MGVVHGVCEQQKRKEIVTFVMGHPVYDRTVGLSEVDIKYHFHNFSFLISQKPKSDIIQIATGGTSNLHGLFWILIKASFYLE